MMAHFARAVQRLVRRAMRPAVPVPVIKQAPVVHHAPATHIEAAARMVDPVYSASPVYLRKLARLPEAGAHPDLLIFSRALLRELKQRNLPFYGHCYYRGPEEQARVFKAGMSKARFGQSAHNFGMAVDIVHAKYHWDLTEKEWALIGLIGKEVARKRGIKVTWGGDWGFYDPAHWELADWKTRPKK